MTLRYFSTRGPATGRDFAWWSGLSMSDVKRGVEIAGRKLRHAPIDGEDFWFAERAVPKPSRSAHLLPNYDEYFIGYKDRSAIGRRLGSAKAVKGEGGVHPAHVVFVDGQLVGGWKRVFEQKAVVVELELVTRLTTAERARVAAAARTFGAFLDMPVTLRG